MKKDELLNKLDGLTEKELARIDIDLDEIEYLKKKVVNDKLGLTLNFSEVDKEEKANYILLEENKELSINPKDKDNNLLIEGDNYHALRALKSTGTKVDVIYIDPPYNTGKEFIYNDNYGNDPKVVGSDDPHKHSKWLSFMKKRLILAKDLLTDEGVIFVSIDDNEQAYLKVLMDEIFGEKTFINQLVWVSNKKGRQITNSAFVKTYEYILMYSKKTNNIFNFTKYERKIAEKEMPCMYVPKNTKIYSDQIGKFIIQNELHNTNIKDFNVDTRKNLYFPIYTNGEKIITLKEKDFSELLPPKNKKGVQGVWRWSKEKVDKESENLYLKKVGENYKIYTKKRDMEYTPKDIIISSSITTKSGGNDLIKLGIEGFSFPKPTKLIEFLIKMTSGNNSIILDFFAGSGTTGQAVMELNKEDGGDRKFILVTNNESTKRTEIEKKDGLNHPELGIACSITRERLFRVINGKGSKDEEIDWEYSNNIKSLKENHVKYLQVKLLDKYNGEFETIEKSKELYEKEFNKDLSIIDLK